MNKDKKIWKYSVEICFSEWNRDKEGHQKSQKFKKICVDEKDQDKVIVEFQQNNDVLIWWIHKWKARLSLSEWFD